MHWAKKLDRIEVVDEMPTQNTVREADGTTWEQCMVMKPTETGGAFCEFHAGHEGPHSHGGLEN